MAGALGSGGGADFLGGAGGAAVGGALPLPRKTCAGALVDHPQLAQLSAMLKAIDAGDRIVKGRVELFCCSRRSLTQRAQQDLQRRAPETITDSPLGPLSTDSAQNLLANLRALLSLLYVHYDCSNITPNDFERCEDKHTVVATINHSLAAVVDRVHRGFLAEFWQVIQDAFDLVGSDVYAFRPTSGSLELSENALTSLHYFLVDQLKGRILFIGCVTKSRGAARGGADSDSDVVLSHDSSASSARSGQGSGSDMGESLQEGEIAFSDGSGDDGMLD
uniref:Repressor of RNA polymerase III transcription n=1 Tax=Zooxanthella nutricula TaxID=1333877 RepID=A0A7S2VL93_9DINO|mmetsp:Transcript_83878/g.256282  ORF Transcript_83878/g.256282 Transcript_83878/m.256282 type:complete len:277 (+) Transcript_83878:39-869(+)